MNQQTAQSPSLDHDAQATRGSGSCILDPGTSGMREIVIEGPARKILVSTGTCGNAAGAGAVLEAVQDEVVLQGLEGTVEVVETGCMGLCHSEPTVKLIDLQLGTSTLLGKVRAEQAADVLAGFDGTENLKDLDQDWFYPEDEANPGSLTQAKIVLRNSGRIDPESVDDYLAHSGYKALARALTGMTAEEVIATVEEAGLRGRGGGGFPTGRKWRLAAETEAPRRFVICNADEGDPGAFMDRAVLEGDPHAVIEAMALTGYAIGAGQGFIYIRAEYPLAIRRLETALAQARERGLLGEDILGSGFTFDIRLKLGAGAFVCGEETALIHSIQGRRGTPAYKPPFPAIAGLWGMPTVVNNVETFANIPAIIRNGPDWFRGIGTPECPGTKVFALAGKINRVGLIEVPMGTPLREIIYRIGGGIRGGREFKAVQTGGPSGGCITAENLDTPIDYESLKALGSMMGSGGMIVMDEDDCMVDVARFFLDFTRDESCGKCTPCRVGSRQLHRILDGICKGQGKPEDLDTIRTLAEAMGIASLCGLGTTAANPVLSTLRNFREEYEAHITDKRCPAGRCRELLTYTIDPEKCKGCTLCKRVCPSHCITGEVREPHRIEERDCIRCGECYKACKKFQAVNKA